MQLRISCLLLAFIILSSAANANKFTFSCDDTYTYFILPEITVEPYEQIFVKPSSTAYPIKGVSRTDIATLRFRRNNTDFRYLRENLRQSSSFEITTKDQSFTFDTAILDFDGKCFSNRSNNPTTFNMNDASTWSKYTGSGSQAGKGKTTTCRTVINEYTVTTTCSTY